MPTTVDLTGLDRLRQRLAKVANPDATPLMVAWMKVIDEDNRRGIQSGLDLNGVPLARVTYRPKGPPVRPRLRGRGGYNPGIGGNLSPAEYRRLAGPPLAPRGTFSRVITNLKTAYTHESSSIWYAYGYWDDVVSNRGVPFLHFHFEGAGRLPRRDLRGVRPDGRDKARRAVRAWMIDAVRSQAVA